MKGILWQDPIKYQLNGNMIMVALAPRFEVPGNGVFKLGVPPKLWEYHIIFFSKINTARNFPLGYFDKTSAFSLMLLSLTSLPGLGPITRDPINMVGFDDHRDNFGELNRENCKKKVKKTSILKSHQPRKEALHLTRCKQSHQHSKHQLQDHTAFWELPVQHNKDYQQHQ